MAIKKATVNGEHQFELNDSEISKFDSIEVSKDEFHVLNDNQSFSAKITESDFQNKEYQVKVNNNTYDVSLINEMDILIKEMGFQLGTSKLVSEINAPMPGLVLEINVSEGQEVKENQSLLILEAMKMENVLSSPRDGVIKSIKVKKGEAVDKNALLLEFEE